MNTTLVYIEKGEEVLMLHRVRKSGDINAGKWIGVGGKFEEGESPEACMRREVFEETGLQVDEYRYAAVVTFSCDDDYELMHLFLVTRFHGELQTCAEGDLEWLPKSQLTEIPHWSGDRIFLSLLFGKPRPFFSLKIVYEKGILLEASLNEHPCLVTDRLILRPWLLEDAETLYHLASDPAVGPPGGWAPHMSVEESLTVIREVLSRPEIYAIVPRGESEPIGCIGLQNFRLAGPDGELFSFFDERKSGDPGLCTKVSLQETGLREGDFTIEAELGYWLGRHSWGQGFIYEASKVLMDRGFRRLNLSRIWCSYFLPNERSRRSQEQLGFQFHHRTAGVKVKALHEVRTEITNVMSRADYFLGVSE